jgi:hypothetical protein
LNTELKLIEEEKKEDHLCAETCPFSSFKEHFPYRKRPEIERHFGFDRSHSDKLF